MRKANATGLTLPARLRLKLRRDAGSGNAAFSA